MVYTYGWRASYHTVIWGCKASSDRWNRRGDEMTVSLLPRVPPAICCATVSHAQLSDIPLRRDTQAPSPYRKYSSYPAEGKVSFS